MSASDEIADSAIRHAVYLMRWSQGTYRRHSKLIDEAVADLSAKLAVRAPAGGEFTAARLKAVLSQTEDISKGLFSAMRKAVSGDLRDLADYEAQFQLNAVQNAFPIRLDLTQVTGAQIHSAAMGQPFRGKTLKDWFGDQEYGVRRAFQQQLRLGYVEGETLSQVTSRLSGVGDMSRRQTRTIVRTATNHLSQMARNTITNANKDLFNDEEWVATLDGRTSAVCRARDGKVYAIGRGPKPPAHLNCRSQRVPITKSWKELGFDDMDEDTPLNERPFVADKRSVKMIPTKDRNKLIGRTTAKNYNGWLKTQPRDFVEETLGKKKAKLYLDGNLSLDKFVNREGRELTLDQIRSKEAAVFNRVFGETD